MSLCALLYLSLVMMVELPFYIKQNWNTEPGESEPQPEPEPEPERDHDSPSLEGCPLVARRQPALGWFSPRRSYKARAAA